MRVGTYFSGECYLSLGGREYKWFNQLIDNSLHACAHGLQHNFPPSLLLRCFTQEPQCFCPLLSLHRPCHISGLISALNIVISSNLRTVHQICSIASIVRNIDLMVCPDCVPQAGSTYPSNVVVNCWCYIATTCSGWCSHKVRDVQGLNIVPSFTHLRHSTEPLLPLFYYSLHPTPNGESHLLCIELH